MRHKIIDEIKRLVEISGTTPGARTFARETRISENEWKGVYWARWGDALIEAGYSPNVIQERLSDDFLLKSYCQATRHYQRAPTKPELRMYSKTSIGFPSYTTLQKHFGTIALAREKAREWAEKNDDFSDIVGFLPSKRSNIDDLAMENLSEGWVYLLKSGNHYKVGRGDDLERRVKQVTTALPEKVDLLHAIKTDDPPGIESYWHRRFKEKRLNGEWFALNAADIKAFKRRKFQ